MRITKNSDAPTAFDVLYMRCVPHRTVPQLNGNGGDGEECAACVAEDVAYARQQAGRLYNMLASLLNNLDALETTGRESVSGRGDQDRTVKVHLANRDLRRQGDELVKELRPIFFEPGKSKVLDAKGKAVEPS